MESKRGHSGSRGAREGQRGRGGPQRKDGDWTCSQCGDLQFARRKCCRSCSAPRGESDDFASPPHVHASTPDSAAPRPTVYKKKSLDVVHFPAPFGKVEWAWECRDCSNTNGGGGGSFICLKCGAKFKGEIPSGIAKEWTCLRCDRTNFKKRTTCFSCRANKPTEDELAVEALKKEKEAEELLKREKAKEAALAARAVEREQHKIDYKNLVSHEGEALLNFLKNGGKLNAVTFDADPSGLSRSPLHESGYLIVFEEGFFAAYDWSQYGDKKSRRLVSRLSEEQFLWCVRKNCNAQFLGIVDQKIYAGRSINGGTTLTSLFFEGRTPPPYFVAADA